MPAASWRIMPGAQHQPVRSDFPLLFGVLAPGIGRKKTGEAHGKSELVGNGGAEKGFE